MAIIKDVKNTKYAGESLVYDCIKDNLPDDVICYYNREVEGKQFDYCLLIEGMGIFLIEVKGWTPDNIIKVLSPDEIYTTLYDKPVISPKKQVNSYKFSLVNVYNDKFYIDPLVMDLVCYPFISLSEYKKLGLDIISEEEFTLFKEDIFNPKRFADKLAKVYKKSKYSEKYRDKFIGTTYDKSKVLFEGYSSQVKTNCLINDYSELRIFSNTILLNDIIDISKNYFQGIKQIIFVNTQDEADQIIKNINSGFLSLGLTVKKRNIEICKSNHDIFEFGKKCYSFFNFELYVIENINSLIDSNLIIKNGKIGSFEPIISKLCEKCSFNYQQYEIEHAPIDKHIYVKAGAGTGKTFSMISRISFICNQSSGSDIFDVKNEIAMLTFTRDAADNMKKRIKQAFLNYFLITKDNKYLDLVSGIENMCISTIHSFTGDIIKNTSTALGIGGDFRTVSGNYQKQLIFDDYLNIFLEKKNSDDSMFFESIPMSMYEFRKKMITFSDSLYEKGFDIKNSTIEAFGVPPAELAFFNEFIEEVIARTEIEYTKLLFDNNSISLKEYMLYLNKCVKDESFNTNLYKYKFIFIDEFQDVDDPQIYAFLKMQSQIGFKFFIVGDLKQSIYRFRGATMAAFDKMGCNNTELWTKYSLNINYRTDSALLETFHPIFNNMGLKGLIPYDSKEDQLKGGINGSDSDESFKIINFDKNDDESKFDKLFKSVLERKRILEERLNGEDLSDAERTIAILVRKNSQINELVRESRNYDDIFLETDSSGDLYRLQSTIDLVKLTAALCNPRNYIYLLDLVMSNNVNISIPVENLIDMTDYEKLNILTDYLDQYFLAIMDCKWKDIVSDIQNKPVLMMLRRIYDKTQPWKSYSRDEDRQLYYRMNYDLVFEELTNDNKNYYLTIESINESLHLLMEIGAQKNSKTIEDNGKKIHIICTTVHKSKGLEYDSVYLPYTYSKIDELQRNSIETTVEDGKVGYCISVDGFSYLNNLFSVKDEIEECMMEESRILYVALTRAINIFVWLKSSRQSDNCWGDMLDYSEV